MPNPETLRDSTEVVLPGDAIAPFRGELESEFAVTIVETDGICRIVGSPVAIKEVVSFLVLRGVSVP